MSLGTRLIDAGQSVSRFADKKGDAHNPIGAAAGALLDNTGDLVKGGAKLVMGLDYGVDAVKDGWGALTDPNNTFLGNPAVEVPTRGLEVMVQGAVAYTSAMIALEGAGQVIKAVGQTIEDTKKRARAIA